MDNTIYGKKDILGLSLEELTVFLGSITKEKYRASQIFRWLHVNRVDSFDEMNNIPKSLKEILNKEAVIYKPKDIEVKISKEDGTRKYLFELYDGNVIESVFMKYHHGNSVCISTQVGCAMGCRFCASTLDGLSRNLTVSEMIGQIYMINKLTGEKISNIVLMGCGEPLHNYDNVVSFLRLITYEKGFNLSVRNITLSTCGLVPKINEFADENIPVTLAISLHASNDEKRRELMPIANRFTIKEILEATDYYFEKTKRRISFEYSLVANVNDTKEDAKSLALLLGNRNAHVNLIPVNPIKERDYKSTDTKFVLRFKNILEKYGINVTIRREMGRDIDGACGQLRKKYIDRDKDKGGTED